MTAPAVDHVALTVTDLDVSQRFYCELLDLVRLADFGTVRVLVHRASGFALSLTRHGDGGGCFDETRTGLETAGLAELRDADLDQAGIDARTREYLAAAGVS